MGELSGEFFWGVLSGKGPGLLLEGGFFFGGRVIFHRVEDQGNCPGWVSGSLCRITKSPCAAVMMGPSWLTQEVHIEKRLLASHTRLAQTFELTMYNYLGTCFL